MSTTLIARVLPYLPGTLVEGSAIDIVQAGLTYTISWDSTEAGFSAFGLQLGAAANAAAAQALLASPLSWRNIIGANGGLEVWQRGAGGTASFAIGASSTAYTADRWYLTSGANEASTVAQVAGISLGSRFAAKVQKNNAQTGTAIYQFGFPLDNDECAIIAGQVVMLSFTAKAGANWSPSGGILNAFLLAGTGAPAKFSAGFTNLTIPINQSPAALTATATRFTALSTAVASNTTQAEVQFQWTPTGTAGADDSFTIDDVQLEVATFVSPFERVSFERSLMSCQRHFWKTFQYQVAPAQNVGVNSGELKGMAGVIGAAVGEWLIGRHPVSMRVAPTSTLFNPSVANAQVRNETRTQDCSASSVNEASTESITVTATGSAATVVGDLLGVHLTIDAGI